MRRDPQLLFRGFGKLIAIVALAGLAGALIGIALASLTDRDDTTAPLASATTAPAIVQTVTPLTPPEILPTDTQTQTRTDLTATTIVPATPARGFLVPTIHVISAQIAPLSADGGTPVTVRVRVTNRGGRALTPEDPVLLEGPDAVPLDSDAKAAARAVRKALEPGETASGVLRFTVPGAVAQRIRDAGRAQLRIATRTITLKLVVA